ncbi:MAG: class I SAM-dependent methyltransferase [Hyphomicrobiaceae bacterium]
MLRHLVGIAKGGHVLDVACGGGRHIAACLDLGLRVTGVDRDTGAARQRFAGKPGLELIEADLEDGRLFPFGPASFDGIVVVNYLWRPVLPAIIGAAKRSGLIIYQTFRTGNERYGKPSNPDFLLRPNELLDAVAGRLLVITYEETHLREPDRLVQRIVAAGPDHTWVNDPPAL